MLCYYDLRMIPIQPKYPLLPYNVERDSFASVDTLETDEIFDGVLIVTIDRISSSKCDIKRVGLIHPNHSTCNVDGRFGFEFALVDALFKKACGSFDGVIFDDE
jgi:hypothetical protein